MTEPSFYILTKHDPHSDMLPWDAQIHRLSDERHVKTVWGTTEYEALTNAQAWVKAENEPRKEGTTVYLDERGVVVPEP